MGMLVDVRKLSMDHFLNEVVDAAKIKTKWWGKKIDNYWLYLDDNIEKITLDIDPYIMSDFFVYMFEDFSFKEKLTEYSEKISAIRKHFVTILIIDDKDILINALSENAFLASFKIFLKELNGEFYNYQDCEIEKTTNGLKKALNLIDDKYGLLINIG
jgi:hypothetical protein